MRDEIIEALCHNATAEEAAAARACAGREGNIVTLLIDAGFHRRRVLAACTEVTGIPKAPTAWFKDPAPIDVSGIDVEQCRRLAFTPIAIEDGELCIAYGDPLVAARRQKLGLPPHKPFLATPTKVARALKHVFSRGGPEQTSSRSRRSPSGSGEGTSQSASSALGNKDRKRRRNERRAASTEGAPALDPSELEQSAASRSSSSRSNLEARDAPPPPPAWEPTTELPSSPAPPAPPRPAPAARRPGSMQVTSFQAAQVGDAAKSFGPLDPPMRPGGRFESLDPPMPPPSARQEAPERRPAARPGPRAPDAPPARRAPKAAERPPQAPTTSRAGALFFVLLIAGAIAAITVARSKGGGGRTRQPQPPPIVDDNGVDVVSRQRAFIAQAAADPSDVGALNALNKAINLDPATEAGRDAFLARVRLHLKAGQHERARRDLERMLRRTDIAPVRAEVEGLLAEIVRKHGPGTDVAPQRVDAGP